VLAATSAHAGPLSVLIDEVVAVVTGKFQGSVPPQVITRWDLESECRLESMMRYGEAGVDRAISKSMKASVLEQIVDESVIYREAARLDGAEVEEAAIDEAYATLAGSFGGSTAFGQLLEKARIPVAKVRTILERRIVVDRYVIDNLRLTMSFTESELESAFETMDHPYKGSNLDDVRDEFREYLLEVMSHEHRDGLIKDLSARCHIWVFLDPAELEVP
jgi:hypothetical protein